jgi:hypothetical protein
LTSSSAASCSRQPKTLPAKPLSDLIARRLRTHHLVGEPFASPAEAVGWFGALQSQDYPAAKWALGQRLGDATDADLDAAFDKGQILRTHVMRPTWHFVLPADIVWIQELTSSRVMAGLAGRHRSLELDARTIARATDVMGEALAGGKFMTRPELGDAVQAAGIAVEGQRLPHLIASAEHANVITSGPRRGKQFTYALLAERAHKARALDREEALKRLTVTYFRSHGPAQLKDFAWWSGLTTQEIRQGIHLAGDELQHEEIDGNDHWSGKDHSASGRAGKPAHLLPNFDEYTVAYRDRSALLDPSVPFDASSFAYYRDASPMGGILSNVVTIGGRVRGAWSRVVTPGLVRVDVRLLAPLSRTETGAVQRAAARLGRFLAAPVELRWRP